MLSITDYMISNGLINDEKALVILGVGLISFTLWWLLLKK